MNIYLKIPLKAISVNQINRTSFKNNSVSYKSKEAKQFKKDLHKFLSTESRVKDFVLFFDEEKHLIEFDYQFFMPVEKVLTKKGRISKTGGDADNYVKWFKDCLFDYIGINDAFSKEGRIGCYPTNGDAYIIAHLKIVRLDTNYYYRNFVN